MSHLKRNNINQLKKLSIITVTFNCADTFQQTLNSFKDQLTEEVEFIVVDGGSTDGTIDLIKKNEHFIDKWVSEKDEGIYDAMNKGISLCTGEYINFMNSGDQFLNIINRVLVDLKRFNPDMAFGGVIFCDDRHIIGIKKPERIVPQRIPGRMPFCHQSCFIKKDIITSVGCFNLKYKIASDYDLISRIIIKPNLRYLELDYSIAKFLIGGVSSNFKKTVAETFESQVSNGLPIWLAALHAFKWFCFQPAKLLPRNLQIWLRKMKATFNL